MFEHQRIAKLRRTSAPAVAGAIVPALPSWASTSARPSEAEGPQRSGIGFDIGTISIFPPEPEVGPEGGELSPDLANRIQRKQGGGSSLEPAVQDRMGTGFGDHFADVRIHTDGESDALNRSVGANAFTLGRDIFLSQEATSAGPYGGDRLLAHELTHVVQQRGAEQSGPLTVSGVNDPEEHEASASAAAVADGGTARPAERVQPGVATARVQRDGAGAKQHPDKAPVPAKKSVAGDVAELKNDVAILKKKEQSDALDLEWHPKFAEKLASYQQAIWRISGGIETANSNFKKAQDDQARADQMWAELFGVGVSVLFSASFEWVATKGLGLLGSRLKRAPKDIVEAIENPANALVGGYMTNVRTTRIANEDAVKGALPTITGKDSAMGFLTGQQDDLAGHAVAIEHAFSARAEKTKEFTEDEWMAYDVEAQAQSYETLFTDLAKAGSDASALASPERIARILERRLWAAWIMRQHDLEIQDMMDTPAQKRFGTQTAEQMANANPDTLSDFGASINQELIDVGVEELSGAPLETHWWQLNGDDWESKLMNWARNYSESLAG